MLKLSHVTLRRGSRVLLEAVDLALHTGQRIGVTGANGSGKSSLFAMLRGQLHSDAGEVELAGTPVIAHVAQETPALACSAIDYVLDGDQELRAVEQALAAAEAADDGSRQGDLHAQLEAIGGYTARARAARLLHGLGFLPGQEESAVSSFSGGWRMRLNLAQALMCRSDILLLDEPTNHLDLDAVLWLEQWLKGYSGMLLLISHDRDFLDQTVNHILHLEHCKLRLYSGGYSDFELARAEQLAQQQAAYERQQREVAHMHRFVERFRAKATKARQAQSRLKALARMERIAPAHVDSPFSFQFPEPERLPSPLLVLEQAAAGYNEQAIVSSLSLTLLPGQRIGLLGGNGAGKSTFIKLLAGELPPLDGTRTAAQDLRLGYFAQHQLEHLDPQVSPLLHLQRLDPRASEQQLRDFLGGFGFHGEQALSPTEPFSGGEKARLALALIIYQRPNLLLLDEPTNHLDLEMRHALTVALQEFSGALLLVSHDRALMRTVADEFWLMSEGRLAPFDGDLDDYRQWLLNRERETAPAATEAPAHSARQRKEDRRREAERRQQLQPLKKQLRNLESKIDKLQLQKSQLAERLADNELYAENRKQELQELLRQQGGVEQELTQAEEQWLIFSEELEAAEAGE